MIPLRKRIVVLLLSFLMLVTCITALPTASATHVEVVIHPDQQYQIGVQLTQGATFVFGWTATHSLSEVFRDPDGASIKIEAGVSSGGTGYVVPTTGQYTMTWTNLQATDATLKVDYFPNINGVVDAWIAIMIIGLIVLVVVVVVIVAVVMRKPKAPPQPPQYQQYQQPPPPPPPSP
ncbi:MAG: hypothetical protein LUO79_08750 [Methanomassiliicoccales archaeon]|nr:hypothetical protein [Methanomassiliicoccales archaeon]